MPVSRDLDGDGVALRACRHADRAAARGVYLAALSMSVETTSSKRSGSLRTSSDSSSSSGPSNSRSFSSHLLAIAAMRWRTTTLASNNSCLSTRPCSVCSRFRRLRGQPSHAVRLPVDRVDGLPAHHRVLAAPLAQDVHVAADARDGRRKLVGRVGDEPYLRRGTLLQPLEQPVDRTREVADLVLAHVGHSRVELARVDRVGRSAQRVDQPQDPLHRRLDQQHHQQRRHDREREHRQADRVDHRLFGGGAIRDVEHAGADALQGRPGRGRRSPPAAPGRTGRPTYWARARPR